MATRHTLNEPDSGLRTTMSVAATLCVLGLATLVWLHDSPQISVAAQPAPFVAVDSPAAGDTGTFGTGVPSAERVFGHATYAEPEVPIAQF